MRKNLKAAVFATVGLLVVSASLFAHHGNAVYDTTKSISVKGTVTRFIWENPHILLLVDAKDDSGNMLHWIIESQAPSNMANYGWTKNIFKPGDEVVADVTPGKNLATNGATIGRFSGRIVVNGKVFKDANSGGR